MSIGHSIRKIRMNSGESQTNFAKKLGISRTYLSDLENDRKSPSIETVTKIAEKLHVSIAFLLEEQAQEINSSMLASDQEAGLLADTAQVVNPLLATIEGQNLLAAIVRFYQANTHQPEVVAQLTQLIKLLTDRNNLTTKELVELRTEFEEILLAFRKEH